MKAVFNKCLINLIEDSGLTLDKTYEGRILCDGKFLVEKDDDGVQNYLLPGEYEIVQE